jgi:dihydrofolate reductase
MRTLVVCNIMSLDGCFTGPGGDVMVMPMDAGFDAYNGERLRAASTLLTGRVSYEGFRDYFSPGAPEGASAEQAANTRRMNEIDKVVVSDSLVPDPGGPWPCTEVVPRALAAERVARLKREAGEEILVFGSRTMWSALLAAGLVDELHLLVGPTVLVDGVRMFDAAPPGGMRLAEAREFEHSGLVLLRYDLRG